jgi:hypothetical protein
MIFAPLAVLLLSGPFLKIVLLTRTGRLAIHDMALLSLFTLIAGALATVMMLSWHKYGLYEEKSASEMAKFATSLNEQIALDLKRIQSTLEGFDKVLPANIVEPADRDRTDLLKDPLPVTPDGPIPFNFVFWTNRNGCQVVKWTTRRFNTLVDCRRHGETVHAANPCFANDLSTHRRDGHAVQSREHSGDGMRYVAGPDRFGRHCRTASFVEWAAGTSGSGIRDRRSRRPRTFPLVPRTQPARKPV